MFGMCYVKQYSVSFNEIIGWTFFTFILEILCIKFHIIFFFTIYLKKILIGHKKGGEYTGCSPIHPSLMDAPLYVEILDNFLQVLQILNNF